VCVCNMNMEPQPESCLRDAEGSPNLELYQSLLSHAHCNFLICLPACQPACLLLSVPVPQLVSVTSVGFRHAECCVSRSCWHSSAASHWAGGFRV
jgi:hypothetical protein